MNYHIKKEKLRFVINDINSRIAELREERENYKIQLVILTFKEIEGGF